MPSPAIAHVLRYKVPAAATVSYDAASTAVFNAYASQPDATRKGLIDAVVVALKAGQNVWSKLDGLYIFACAEVQGSLINWINPGTYNASAVNSPTFGTDSGYTGGATKYLDSGFNPTTAGSPKFTQDSASAFGWSNTSTGIAGALWGVVVNTSGRNNLYSRYTNDNSYFRGNNGTGVVVSNVDGKGFYAVDRSSSAALAGFKNGSSVASSGASTSGAPDNSDFAFMTYAAATEPFTGVMLCGGFGQSLGTTGQSELYAALHTYMQAVAGVA